MVKGFILAAGYSKRLRPITEFIPKPLLPIAGQNLLDYIYKSLKFLEIDEIGINLHYKADEIKNYIDQNNLPLRIFHEKKLLETGGALYNAKNFLKDSIFVVHNADIYWDGNIKEAIQWHINSENAITLLVHDYSADNKLIVDEEGNLIAFINQNHSEFGGKLTVAFTGIAIYNAEVLDLLPAGHSSIINLWLNAKTQGFKVKVFPVKYSFWYDIGTPVGFACAVFDKLKRNFSSLYVHPTSTGCHLIEAEGNIVIERDVRIKKTFKAKNVIILPQTEISRSMKQNPVYQLQQISDCIIGNNFIVSICGWQRQEEKLSHGGSNRKYFRKQYMVFCQWEEIDQEFEKTVTLGKFLKNKGFLVPEIIEVDRQKKLIVFEDLGDLTLYSWLQCKRKNGEILKVYKKIIEQITQLHWKISWELKEMALSILQFDYEYFRWESEYFIKECVNAVFNLKNELSILEKDLHFIADRLSKTQKVVLHRDLQSQNIMLKNQKPYFIDYQSARWGPAGYDIASLLYDPYVNLNKQIRQDLVRYYIEKSLKISSSSLNFNPSTFLEELTLCKIQRHMQALGAYGFLSLKRGKKEFLRFIPSALNLLKEDIEECPFLLTNLKELTDFLLNQPLPKILLSEFN